MSGFTRGLVVHCFLSITLDLLQDRDRSLFAWSVGVLIGSSVSAVASTQARVLVQSQFVGSAVVKGSRTIVVRVLVGASATSKASLGINARRVSAKIIEPS